MRQGRYGVEYARRAEEIRLAAQQCGARDVLIRQFDEDALRFCLIPACEDERLRLHVRLDTRAQMDGFLRQLDASQLCARWRSGDEAVEPMLIEAAATRRRLLVRVNKRIPLALEKLGLRFVPYGQRWAGNLPGADAGAMDHGQRGDLARAVRRLSAAGQMRLSVDQRSDCKGRSSPVRRAFSDG